MRAILEEEGLFEHALGTAVTPTAEPALTTHNTSKRKCKNKLILSIDEQLLDLILDYDDPKDIWSKLQSLFQPKTRLSRLQAYRAFLMARLEQGKDVGIKST